MRGALLVFILCAACVCAGCSFSSDFVILNNSDQPVQVTYTLAESGSDVPSITGTGTPAVLDVDDLRGRDWRPLSKDEYSFDPPTRTVTVSLPPNQALLIDGGGEWRSDSECPSGFDIERVQLIGIKGWKVVEGDNACKSFVVLPKRFYTFGPPTQMILTYE